MTCAPIDEPGVGELRPIRSRATTAGGV